MKKSVLKIISVLMALLLLCGCDSYRAFMSIESGTLKSWSQRHDLLDGKKSHILFLKADSKMEIDVETEDGKIDITVKSLSGEEIIEIENAETGSFEFEAEGFVKITVNADEHRGSVSVKQKES